ncbi:MAG TPA: 3-deoxy-manno-octulosonate cytidylyltransferase [Vicinamibacterales bacterium]
MPPASSLRNPSTGPSLRCIALIPARYASTRLPGKALADIAGRPMIAHVYARAAASTLISDVIVATDDERIREAVERCGGTARLTKATHRSGTDRLAELASALDCDVIVNVQGDEPLLDPRMIDDLIAPLAANPDVPMSTLRRPITNAHDWTSPDVVKVVVDQHDFALYFSRSPIPFDARRPRSAGPVHDAAASPSMGHKHIGLYAYRREFLLTLAALPPTRLEQLESLEQLRALEHGYRIQVPETAFDSVGVDTPADLERVRRLMAVAETSGHDER